MKTQCLIVDDEPLAIEVIASHLQNFSELVIAGSCNNAIEAFEFIKKNKIDLLFLDIQMPEMNGLSFVKSLKQPPRIIITTAYREFAVDGFDLNVLDYLLKPISLERFIQAIDKYYASLPEPSTKNQDILLTSESNRASLFVKTDRKMVRIFLDEIYFIESLKEYVIVHTKDKKIVTKTTMSSLETTLPGQDFARIHRSFIVAVQKVTAYTQASVEVLNKELPIGRNYKFEAQKRLTN